MFDGATALVTGAAGGIGRALAERLTGRGATVHLVDIDEVAVEDAAAEIAGSTPWVVDVSDDAAVADLAAAIPSLDVLCCNAGITGPSLGTPWAAPADEWQRVVGVNLFGVVNCLRHLVPSLSPPGAHLLITASLAGAATWPGGGAYGASKHALLALAEQASMELAETGVSVTVACPALVATGMSDVGADPRDVADEMLDAARAGRFAIVPDEWRAAVVHRARRLVDGRPPEPPAPT